MKLTKYIMGVAVALMIVLSPAAHAGNAIIDWDTPIQFETPDEKLIKQNNLGLIEGKAAGAPVGMGVGGPIVIPSATGNSVMIDQSIYCEAGAVCKDNTQSTGTITQDNSGEQQVDTNISGNNFNGGD